VDADGVALEVDFGQVRQRAEDVDVEDGEDLVVGDVKHCQVGKLFFNAEERNDTISNETEIFQVDHFLEAI
jgi:hypothetical protein